EQLRLRRDERGAFVQALRKVNHKRSIGRIECRDQFYFAAEYFCKKVCALLQTPPHRLGFTRTKRHYADFIVVNLTTQAADTPFVIAVERVGQAQQRRQLPHDLAVLNPESGVILMLRFGQAAAVVISDVSDDGYLRRSETGQLAVLYKVGRMLVMASVRDEIADVVKQRPRREQPPVLAAQGMQRAQLVKQLLGQISHPARVLQVGSTVTRESQRASQARVAFQSRGRGGNRLDATRQMGDDHAFTQRPVASDHLVNFQRLRQGFEQLAARDDDLGA